MPDVATGFTSAIPNLHRLGLKPKTAQLAKRLMRLEGAYECSVLLSHPKTSGPNLHGRLNELRQAGFGIEADTACNCDMRCRKARMDAKAARRTYTPNYAYRLVSIPGVLRD